MLRTQVARECSFQFRCYVGHGQTSSTTLDRFPAGARSEPTDAPASGLEPSLQRHTRLIRKKLKLRKIFKEQISHRHGMTWTPQPGSESANQWISLELLTIPGHSFPLKPTSLRA